MASAGNRMAVITTTCGTFFALQPCSTQVGLVGGRSVPVRLFWLLACNVRPRKHGKWESKVQCDLELAVEARHLQSGGHPPVGWATNTALNFVTKAGVAHPKDAMTQINFGRR
eukprot:4039837-Amphidinium_carterae.1